MLFISVPLAPQIPSLRYSESCPFWQPLGTGACCDPEEQEEHCMVRDLGRVHGAALGELSNNCQKKQRYFQHFYSGVDFERCVFVLCWQW